ncbi:M23 family metallopeptidase [Aquimarina pacifica]|uniref:M23 family metallopeptidase n=1 Tax=Aquimarina pacifica TaxID=1296415 RepID=UPI0004710DF9|nr:M23 family metallopeptidase [Aquimarina pacifica]
MKTLYIYRQLFTVILLVCYTTAYTQNTEKQVAEGNINNIPTHFPIAKGDFKTISSPFGYRKHPILHKNKLHAGIDLVAPKGAAVLATASGIVQKSEYQKGYGNYILLAHFAEVQTLYAHLWISLVKKGDAVVQGQIIGLVGETGLATGPHLHYEVRVNNKKLDPMRIWKGIIREHSNNKV